MATREADRKVEDRDLVLAFQAGDQNAYDVIFERYGPMTERICRRYLANPHDAEEAAQETMIRVLRSLPSFNGRYNLRGWVARIATNLCLDRLRQEARKSNGEDLSIVFLEAQNSDATKEADPGEAIERVVNREEIRANLEQLPEQHRVAILLRDVEGLGHKEIAEVMQTTPARVKALLHRAHKGFRLKWNGGERALGVVALPFLWLGNMLRRAQGRAQEMVTSGAAASPQMSTLAATGGDHVSAALAAVVLAGSVGFAAGSAPAPAPAEPQARQETVTLTTAPVFEEPQASRDREQRREPKPDRNKKEAVAPVVAAPVEQIAAGPDHEVDPKEASAAQKTVLPEPEPAATVRPAPAVPSGFTFGFTSDWVAGQPCNCTDQPRIVEQILIDERGEPADFSTRIEGGVLRDKNGQPGWPIEVIQSGTRADQSFEFVVHTATGAHTYSANGTYVTRERTTWGGWTYHFSGTYAAKGDGPEEATPLPTGGTYTASLTFAVREGRLVEAAFQLSGSEYAA